MKLLKYGGAINLLLLLSIKFILILFLSKELKAAYYFDFLAEISDMFLTFYTMNLKREIFEI